MVKAAIQSAFGHVKYPATGCLVNSNEGDEPELVEKAFRGRKDWMSLSAEFLDRAPEDSDASALNFFSDEAFHFYLPAYLIADIDFGVKKADPVFNLTHGLTEESKNERINPLRYGERTWFDVARYKFSIFNNEEVSAIVAYLNFKMEIGDKFERHRIKEALENYWLPRVQELKAS